MNTGIDRLTLQAAMNGNPEAQRRMGRYFESVKIKESAMKEAIVNPPSASMKRISSARNRPSM